MNTHLISIVIKIYKDFIKMCLKHSSRYMELFIDLIQEISQQAKIKHSNDSLIGTNIE